MNKIPLPRIATLLAAAVVVAVFTVSAAAPPQGAAGTATATCTTANVLSGSDFEIDTDANLKVDGASPCIDWLAGGTGSGLRTGVSAKSDPNTGASDDAFGQGTSEDEANPTIVTGSIPPNKSDLKVFGVYTETSSTGDKFLELFWSRVQNPSGTTNMDFELNQLFCDPGATPTNCADNGPVATETPIRTAGDKLITYDLARGGTVPTISIRTWIGEAIVNGKTVAAHWGPATVLTSTGDALGSVNTSTVSAADSDGVGPLDPFTFGEAAISFAALFPQGSCGSFGSTYLKSRSSTSFTAELKDFIPPERVQIGACTPTITTSLSSGSAPFGGSVHDSATLHGASSDAGGTVTYSVYTNNTCTGTPFDSGGTVTVTNGIVLDSNDVTFNQAGTFYWQATYSGDAKNNPTASDCTSEALSVARAAPTISTTLSRTLISLGQSVTDSATLSGASSDAGGTVTYSVYANSTCTGTTFASGGTKPVTNGVVPDSNPVTFNSGGTFYWRALYSGDANNAGASSACASEQLRVIGQCVLGYPDSSNPGRSNLIFNESEVLRAFGTFNTDPRGLRVALFYNDEHALELGIRQNSVKTAAGTSVVGSYPVSPLTANPDHVSPVQVGSQDIDPGDSDAIDQDGVDTALPITLQGKTGQGSQGGRPMFPALFITDITNGDSRAGDWQQGTLASRVAHKPDDVYGTWKSATRLVDKTTSPFTVTTAVDADPAKNNWNLGAGSDTPSGGFAALKNEGFGAEASWNASGVGLQSGHAYRLQFMDHDGDQNKSGGDSGEACVNVVIP